MTRLFWGDKDQMPRLFHRVLHGVCSPWCQTPYGLVSDTRRAGVRHMTGWCQASIGRVSNRCQAYLQLRYGQKLPGRGRPVRHALQFAECVAKELLSEIGTANAIDKMPPIGRQVLWKVDFPLQHPFFARWQHGFNSGSDSRPLWLHLFVMCHALLFLAFSTSWSKSRYATSARLIRCWFIRSWIFFLRTDEWDTSTWWNVCRNFYHLEIYLYKHGLPIRNILLLEFCQNSYWQYSMNFRQITSPSWHGECDR